MRLRRGPGGSRTWPASGGRCGEGWPERAKWVPAAGLYHVRYRWYDAGNGTWISKDPAGYVDGASLFGYVAQQPINTVDPMGLWKWDRDLLQYGVPGLLGFHGREAADAGWNEYSESTYGVVGTFTGGLFDEDYGFLGYKDEVLDFVGHDDTDAYDSGKCSGRVAVTALLGIAARHAVTGREYCFGPNLRIAPWGNRTGHPTGRFPHYHRRIFDGQGNPVSGGGMRWHRPWDTPGGGGPRW